MKKNVVLVDYIQDKDWDFIRGLEDSSGIGWETECMESSGLHGGVKTLVRYYTYFKLAFKVFRHRDKYEKVIAWQQFFGIFFSFYCKLFRVDLMKCPELYVMELIYKPKKGFFGNLYKKFIGYCLNSPYITRIIVFSKDEKEYYQSIFKLSNSVIDTVHYGLQDSYEKYKKYISNNRYYIAAGRSNRDYGFLIDVWPRELQLKIICDNQKLKVGDNIQLLDKCYREDYFKELAGCHAVIIPLKDKNASSGQLVMLQAMMLGKPVIVTENNTVRDYIIENEDGFIVNASGEELRESIKKLDDNEIWKKMSATGRNHFLEFHSMRAMGTSVGKLIAGEK